MSSQRIHQNAFDQIHGQKLKIAKPETSGLPIMHMFGHPFKVVCTA